MRLPFYVLALMATVFCVTGCGPDNKKRYDTPLTYAQAIKNPDIKIPLPVSARNINYATYSDWQAYQCFVRFEGPVEDCIRHIDAVLAWSNQVHNRTSSYPRIDVTEVESHDGDSTMGPIRWFDVSKVKRGIYAGKSGSYCPEIWVDTDRGVFYYFTSD